MIITQDIKSLVYQIEGGDERRETILRLVKALDESCGKHKGAYATDFARYAHMNRYPVDAEGYAVSFDPLEDEKGFRATWQKYGVVVGKQIAPKAVRKRALLRISEIFDEVSGGTFDANNPATYAHMPLDRDGNSFVSRGFMEVYHDDALAQIRQNVRGYIHHVIIWGTARLWTSYDRLGVKLPATANEGGKALPLHVDQNPRFNPGFTSLQGVLALDDCPLERGTFRGVPGSRGVFQHYARVVEGLPEYVELTKAHPDSAELERKAQALPLRGGDLISWDSRTTHANTDNISNNTRYVAYVSAGLASEFNARAVDARMDAYARGSATSVIKSPQALIRATIKPRYHFEAEEWRHIRQSENLNLLGKLLYGTAKYKNIIGAPVA